MKFKVLIDKSTIKENNPDQRSILETKSKHYSFFLSGNDPNKDLFSLLSGYMSSYEIRSDSAFNICVDFVSEDDAYIIKDILQRHKNNLEKVEINERIIMNFTPCAPKPQYSFEYLPTFVECEGCRSKFDFNFLKVSYDMDGYEFENICPICERSHCCEIEFQSIEEALEEMKK